MKSGDKIFDFKSKDIIKESSIEDVKLRKLINKLSSVKESIIRQSKNKNL